MTLTAILILAVVQGLTEFLPVSSSGHLVVAEALFESLGWGAVPESLEVNIVLHLGTLVSVILYFWRDIVRLLGSDRRVVPLLVVGTIPAGLVGLGIKKVAPESWEHALLNPLLAGCLFPVTAALLIWANRRPQQEGEYTHLGFREAVLIGVFQAIAILPGISRSGATIVGGLAMGLRRDASATFAFLLAIPAIAGAGFLEGLEMLEGQSSTTPASVLAAGFAVSTVVGLVALAALIRFLRRGRLTVFAWYLLPLGAAVISWQLFAR